MLFTPSFLKQCIVMALWFFSSFASIVLNKYILTTLDVDASLLGKMTNLLFYIFTKIYCSLLHTLIFIYCSLLHTLRFIYCCLLHNLRFIYCSLLHTLIFIYCSLLHNLRFIYRSLLHNLIVSLLTC